LRSLRTLLWIVVQGAQREKAKRDEITALKEIYRGIGFPSPTRWMPQVVKPPRGTWSRNTRKTLTGEEEEKEDEDDVCGSNVRQTPTASSDSC